jgi:peptidoglycan/LPS O-acetylase OafA/YrhL
MIDVKKYPFIDALRGLAVLAVLFTHSANVAMPIDVTLNWFVQLSANGVQLFYIASSIAICMSWDAKNIAGNSSKFDFYLRRFFRIAPMFYLSIILYLFVDGLSSRYWAPNGIEIGRAHV